MEKAMKYRKYNQHRRIESKTCRKNKEIKPTDNRRVILHLEISHAEDIDKPHLYPSVVNRDYGMVVWVRPGVEIGTDMVEGLPNPVWKANGDILLGEDPYAYPFLNVEIYRFHSMCDPGTSIGRVAVGRATIPFPKELNQIKKGPFELVRFDHEGGGVKPEGQVFLSMELERLECINNA